LAFATLFSSPQRPMFPDYSQSAALFHPWAWRSGPTPEVQGE
jgi:hypothetical protein